MQAVLLCIAKTTVCQLGQASAILQAGHSGRSTSDGEYDWPQTRLDYDHHGRHLSTDPFLDVSPGPATYLYGMFAALNTLLSSKSRLHIALSGHVSRNSNTYACSSRQHAHCPIETHCTKQQVRLQFKAVCRSLWPDRQSAG